MTAPVFTAVVLEAAVHSSSSCSRGSRVLYGVFFENKRHMNHRRDDVQLERTEVA